MNPADLQTLVTDVNALLVCEFGPSIPLTLPAADQVDRMLDQSSIVQCNRRMAQFCGYGCPGDMYGLSLRTVLGNTFGNASSVMADGVRQRLMHVVMTGHHQEGLMSSWQAEGQQRDFLASYHGVVKNGLLERLVILYQDETERRRQEHLIFDIAQQLGSPAEVDSGSGCPEDFFTRLIGQLARYLRVDAVLVGELTMIDAPDDAIHTLGLWYRGEVQPELTYRIAGGPCAEVTGHKVCNFSRGVAKLFPDDRLLQEINAEAYMGVPLYGEAGRQIGILSLAHDRPVPNEQLARSLLTIFSMRAAPEIERLRRRRAARMREARRQVFFDDAPHGMHVAEVEPPMPMSLTIPQQVRWLSDHGRYAECNLAFAHMLGLRHPDEVIGKAFLDAGATYDLAGHSRILINHGFRLRDHPVKCVLPDGTERWLAYTASPVIGPEGLSRLLVVTADITERMLYTRQIEHRARHDSLTDLPNRSYFYEVVEQHLAEADVPLAVFILDLDGFKEINDTLGHEMGDHLLREIGPRLQQAMAGHGAMVARLGGDEFAILLPDYVDFSAVKGLADTVLEAVRRPFQVLELELVIGASMGIALYPEQGDSVSALMRCADIAMYQAKRHTHQVELYRSDLDHYTVRRLGLMMDIRQAVVNEELRLVYQPIVEIESREVLGFEALLRWEHPQHGLLSPAEFIPLVELTDMMEPLTWWVLENTTRALVEWHRRGWDFQLSVNISARNVSDSRFSDRIAALLRERGLDGESLILEITESALMADPEQARRVLQSLGEVGVRFSIDDYGTGYSSLAYLRSLPIHTLKIDRTFISQMLESEQDHIIVTSTIQLAHNLGLEVTAEGIESNAVLAELRVLGCDRGQGFFIARPLADADIAGWVALHERLRLNLRNYDHDNGNAEQI